MINGFGKRLKYQERWEGPCFGQGVLFRSTPRAYQDSHSHTCRMSRFQVCQGITDANRLCQVQSMHLGCLQKQSGLGLATQTVILRSMWAHKRIIHSPACSINLFQNSFMDQQGSFHRYHPPAHRRLVGNKNHLDLRLGKNRQCPQRTLNKFNIFPSADIIRPVFNDDPIPVEE